jgi:AbrB family looped-hinge helix DNA binding protein
MTSVQRILGGKRISIPAEASRELNLDEGDFVIVKVEDGSMRITPAKVIPRK